MTETTTHTTSTVGAPDAPAGADAAVAWLEEEFPGWSVTVDRTASWQGEFRPLWIARSPGHHPQAELTAAKLHSRLSDYLEREERRHALRN